MPCPESIRKGRTYEAKTAPAGHRRDPQIFQGSADDGLHLAPEKFDSPGLFGALLVQDLHKRYSKLQDTAIGRKLSGGQVCLVRSLSSAPN